MTVFGVITVLLGAAAVCLATVPAEAADVFAPADADVDRVARMMVSDLVPSEAQWRRAASRVAMKDTVSRAEALLNVVLPELTDDVYLDYSKTGNRRRGEAVIFERRGRLPVFTIAECVEGKGRFLPKLEELIRSICTEKSWVLPAHDGNLQTFKNELITIDLASSLLSWNLAAAYRMLGNRLSPETRTLIRSELERRTFEPYRRMCSGKQAQAWLLSRMNWNSVCLAGVTGAGLLALDDPKERAWFALAAEHYSRYALEGFTPDGYCDEGVSYWNYGFGHYASLAETIRRATGGGMDLMNRRAAVMPSAYGFQIEIVPGICPAFADCPVNASPSRGLLDYLSRRFTGKGIMRSRATICGALFDQIMALFPTRAPVVKPEIPWPTPDPLRTWFPDHSVLIARPGPKSTSRMSIALQGGHNAQNHNHNDVGVFMVVVGKVAVLPDVGAEVYTRRTFRAQRYVSKALNSWGHAVPVIAGQLQRSGRNAEAKVLVKEFGPDQDRLTLDIRSAYGVPELVRLERAYVYDRAGSGSLEVTDRFEFTSPQTFETALMTFGKWERQGPTTLRIADGGEAVLVHLNIPDGASVEVIGETLNEDLTARRTATRIGLKLAAPLQKGTVTMTIVPEERP